MSKLGENIKKFRIEKDLTQDELAHQLGYKGKTAVSNWENGTNSPNDSAIEKMLNIFEVNANTLFGWTNAAQIKSDAEELADLILSDIKVKDFVTSIKNLSPEDMSMGMSVVERLKKGASQGGNH